MKAFISIVLVVASVSGLRSGPYLPSGWRPEGPGFYLPSEIQPRPADNPLKQTLFQETEASGSDSLREYGPPKIEVSQVVSNQGLPDVATEQTFQIAVKTIETVEENSENTVATNEKSTAVEEAAVTESIVVEAKTDSVVTENVSENIAEEHKVSTIENIVKEQTGSVETVSSLVNVVEEQTGPIKITPVLENVVEEQLGSAGTATTLENSVEVQTDAVATVSTVENIVEEQVGSDATVSTFENAAEEQTGSIATVSTLENIVEERARSVATASTLENKVEEQAGSVASVSTLENVVEEQTASAATVSTFEDAVEEQTGSVITVSTLENIVEEQARPVVTEPIFEGRSLNIDIQSEVEGTTLASVDLVEASQVSDEVETTEKNFEVSQQVVLQTSVQDKSAEVVENKAEEAVVENVSELKTTVEVSGEEKLQEIQREELTIVEEVKTVVNDGVKNIAEALVNLENEIKADQVQTEVKLVQDQEGQISGTLEQLPEGFLEYGPPGFREYGPPNADDLLRSTDIQETIDSIGTNELRKRRFSPKFRSTKKH